MVNPVNSGVNQATLNPFQKRIDDQIKNPAARETEDNAAAGQRRADERQEERPAQQSAQARNDNSSRQGSSGSQRGSLIDVTV